MRTRTKILDAALDIFSEKNFSNVTMSEIAERVGMTKGAVYWHFRSKNDILVQLIQEKCRESESNFMDIYGAPKSIESLGAYYKNALLCPLQDARYKKVHTLMSRRHEWPDDVRASVIALLKDSGERERKILEMLIAKAQSEGRITSEFSAAEVSLTISAVFHGLFTLMLSGVLPPDFADRLDFLSASFKKGLAPDDGRN